MPSEMIYETESYITQILIPSTVEKFKEKHESSKRKKKSEKNLDRENKVKKKISNFNEDMGLNSQLNKGFKVVVEDGVNN